MPWFRYHLYMLLKKKYVTLTSVLLCLVFFAYYYIGFGFESDTDRILNQKNYINTYTLESFELTRLFIMLIVVFLSKESIVTDDHLVKKMTDETKYIYYKQLTFIMIYTVFTILFFIVFQLVGLILYDLLILDYDFLVMLLTNALIIHTLVILLSSKNNHLWMSISIMIGYLIITRIQASDGIMSEIISFIMPFDMLKDGYLNKIHIALVSILYIYAIYLREIKLNIIKTLTLS